MPRFHAPDGRGLHFEDSGGAGPAVLCLAGLSRNARDFDAVAERLSPRFRVIRLDSRGRGRSDRAADPAAEYTVPVEAGDALALLDHLGLSGVGLAGTSRGGLLAMAIAAARPEALAAVALNDIGPVVRGAGLERIFAALAAAAAPPESFEAAAEALCAANAERFPGVPLARWLAHARATHDPGPDGRPVYACDPELPRVIAAGARPDPGAPVPDVEIWPLFEALSPLPVLAIRGANSDILSAETLAEMAARHPRLEAVTVPDRGHAPFLDEPEALDALEAFFIRTLAP